MKLNEILKDKKRIRKITECLISIREFINDTSSTVLCPFHNDNKPSSHIYSDLDGVDRLFCYSCNKNFTSYDYIEKELGFNVAQYLLSRFDVNRIVVENNHITFGEFSNEKLRLIEDIYEECNGDFTDFINRIYGVVK